MTNIDNDENDNLIDDREEATLGMTEIDGFDFERAAMLMSIMEKVANVAPKSSALSGLAAAALNEMNEEAKEIARRRAEEFAKAEAKAQAEAIVAAKQEQARQDEANAEGEVHLDPAPPDDELRLHPAQPVRRAIPSASMPADGRRL